MNTMNDLLLFGPSLGLDFGAYQVLPLYVVHVSLAGTVRAGRGR
jgi:hypothetical protein